MKKSVEFASVLTVSAIVIVLSMLILKEGRYYGISVLLMSLLPLLAATAAKLKIIRLVPDIIFGAIDTGMLTIAAIIGASAFGIIGAVIGGVVGDAVTDAIAGFFEGGIAEWFRSKGIEENRTALGSACGKMTGCLAGSGFVLVIVSALGMEISGFF